MPSSTSGRSGLWIVVALAVGALAFLIVGDPLHLFGAAADREGLEEGAGEELTAGGARSGAQDPKDHDGPELAALYGAGDLGGVKLRLLDASTGKARGKQDVGGRPRGGPPPRPHLRSRWAHQSRDKCGLTFRSLFRRRQTP